MKYLLCLDDGSMREFAASSIEQANYYAAAILRELDINDLSIIRLYQNTYTGRCQDLKRGNQYLPEKRGLEKIMDEPGRLEAAEHVEAAFKKLEN